MDALPKANEAVIPAEKFTDYVLDPMKSHGKWIAFREALGYTKDNVDLLIANIKQNLKFFPPSKKATKAMAKHTLFLWF